MAEDLKFAFVVTGHNNPGKPPRTFTNMANVHVASMINRLRTDKKGMGALITKPARVRFVHFSFVDNDIFIRDEFFGEQGNKADRAWKNKSAATDTLSSFLNQPFVNAPALSIVDVYHAVRNARPTGTVIDLSIYSHGFIDGPVLAADSTDGFYVGAFFNGDPSTPKRDPADLDPRARTDFFSNMGEDPNGAGAGALAQFLGGFKQGGSFRTFGCNVQDVVIAGTNPANERVFLRSLPFHVLREAYVLPVAKRTAVGKQLLNNQPPISITLDMGAEFAIELSIIQDPKRNDGAYSTTFQGQPIDANTLLLLHYGDEPLLFPSNAGPTVSVPFSDVIKFAARRLLDSYIGRAAAGLPGVTCFGAPPGTSGDLDQKGAGEFLLMNVNRKDFGSRLDFYDTYLGLKNREDGVKQQRNYGIFDTNTIATLKNHRDHG